MKYLIEFLILHIDFLSYLISHVHRLHNAYRIVYQILIFSHILSLLDLFNFLLRPGFELMTSFQISRWHFNHSAIGLIYI